MSKTLVITDNKILNQLYRINLETYLATEVILALSIQKAKELILSKKIYNLIIITDIINDSECALEFNNFLIVNNVKAKVIVIGHPKHEILGATIVQSSYHLQELLRTSAQMLGVTAKKMALLETPEYIAIGTHFLVLLKETPCSIYLKIKKTEMDSQFVMLAKKGNNLPEIIKKLEDNDVKNFFINHLDRLVMIGEISTALCEFIKKAEKLGVVDKTAALSRGFNFFAQDFAKTPEASSEIVKMAKVCIKTMEEIVNEVPQLSDLLSALIANKEGYIYTHSILSAFVANHIIKKVSWGGVAHIEKVNFVLFFHDAMLAPIYIKYPELRSEEDLLVSKKLTDHERDIVLKHAQLAAELVASYKKCPMGVDLLIKQHHGMTTGVGFAKNFNDNISPLSKVVIIAEAFVEEYIQGKENDSDFQLDIKKIIKSLNEKFTKSSYRLIIETFETLKL